MGFPIIYRGTSGHVTYIGNTWWSHDRDTIIPVGHMIGTTQQTCSLGPGQLCFFLHLLCYAQRFAYCAFILSPIVLKLGHLK